MLALAIPAAVAITGCSTPSLSHRKVAISVSRNPASCGGRLHRRRGRDVRRWIANDDLIDYAMNDLFNKAANEGDLRAERPQLGNGHGTTTTVTITDTAYRCSG